MNGTALVVRALHHGEEHLARRLTAVGERHRTEHEVHHVSADLAAWSREHVQRLADIAGAYGLDLDGPAEPGRGPVPAPRETVTGTAGRWSAPGLLLLRDLRDLHLDAAENSVHWEMLAQVAQASRDSGLLELVSSCHPRTLRQMRWSNTMLKNLSPQILTSM
ncbi:hypothetical protein [Streptomyces sp. B1I3]|uniref:hypothetical protein n=1 Tax=Streptomyces sp. B1I3 TaxID=3042264 RepID=UPI00277DCE7E|nr:hypothetical protein [Streptomyces sp. B1I3]MDQ0797841.1 hypothetical protein [Streptomyces sp. B1I3]